MKKKLTFLTILISIFFFNTKDVYAYSSSDYINRTLCGSWEVAEFFADGTITAKSCHNTIDEAKLAMIKDGNPNLAVMAGAPGNVKIYAANRALVDFTGPNELIYMYADDQLRTEHSYMNGQSTYGAVDGALLDVAYSHTANTFSNRVRIGGFDGWVRAGSIEIVPLIWVKSASSYTVTNESIRHNYVAKIQNTYSGSSGNTIGPKPDMLEVGTYYSYDGHYFYKDLDTMLKDYQNGNYNNSVNKDKPYYNYYQFLPQHTRTTYSSINIDEYTRNIMGYGRDVYGTTALSKQSISTSRLYGQGAFFYHAQEKYGANALLAYGVSRNESGNGRSNLSINKNNGFGLNAVDSNPTQAANYFPTFSQSILDYSNVWVTYGYSEPTDWRYFGAQNGNKFVGMNVKYASDVYWGEKMASNYYNLDKAYGFQDYNFYQTGITTTSTYTYSSTNTSSKKVYNIKSKDAGLVIIDEIEGQEINGNKTWYKIVSDMNIDSNFNQLTSGYYNWNSYVYIPAAYVLKTNTGKNGYISPNEVTEYQDKNYTYDLFTEHGALKPKVAVSTKETIYYYDPTLQSAKAQSLLKNRYVMVYAAAYNENKEIVSYLVTSDYMYSQKHWVSADSIRLTTAKYAQASVTVPNTNTYSLVNPTTVDSVANHISGLYHYAYTPVLEEKTINNVLWYKVPVDLSGNNQEFGWTMQQDTNVYLTLYEYKSGNTLPVINASDIEIVEKQEFDPMTNVTAIDAEEGDITSKIKITANNVNKDKPGKYQITYEVKDSYEVPVTKTITVTVIADQEPVINVTDLITVLGEKLTKEDLINSITVTDNEDGKITTNITVDDSKVNYDTEGEYEITFTVKDSFGHIVTKTVKITVVETPNIEDMTESEGVFYFDYLDKINNKLQLRGYLTINGMNNTLKEDIVYLVTFKDTNNKENEYVQSAERITDLTEITRPIFSPDGKTYTHAWFKIDLDVDSLPIGNYTMTVSALSDTHYSTALVTNKLYKTEVTGYKSEERTVNIKNNYSDRTSAVTLYIRDKDTPTKTVGSYYNQYDIWRTFDFVDNKLHIKGATYSYGMNLAKDQKVTRTMIFENIETYKTYTYDIGSITNGLYQVALPESDNLDKTRAWYETSLDLTKLPKGKYKLYISTTANETDYSEFTDNLGRSLADKKITLDKKTYQFSLNKEKGNSIELEVS